MKKIKKLESLKGILFTDITKADFIGSGNSAGNTPSDTVSYFPGTKTPRDTDPDSDRVVLAWK